MALSSPKPRSPPPIPASPDEAAPLQPSPRRTRGLCRGCVDPRPGLARLPLTRRSGLGRYEAPGVHRQHPPRPHRPGRHESKTLPPSTFPSTRSQSAASPPAAIAKHFSAKPKRQPATASTASPFPSTSASIPPPTAPGISPPRGLLRWRLLLHSPEALSLNFGFTRYLMPEGGAPAHQHPGHSLPLPRLHRCGQ